MNVEEIRNEDMLSHIGSVRYENLELDAVAEDVVVTSTKLVGAGRGSGVPVELEMATVMQFESGKLRREVVHRSRQEVMAAAMEFADA